MGKEIEHKYLVISKDYRFLADRSISISQGYLSRVPDRVVRIRIIENKGYITIKGRNAGDTRLEFEYEIPLADAERLLSLCEGVVIKKKRWIVTFQGYKWEVDEYLSPVFPTIAEIELSHSHHDYPLPSFIGEEVTGNEKYYNSNIG
ncbi:MAG: CYTH domain-containing protein [Bacteroidales bacterium]|nr:CYTH domain-containing protein [Bacteroidales bacterium]